MGSIQAARLFSVIAIVLVVVSCQTNNVGDKSATTPKVGPAYFSDRNGGYTRISKEQATCQMMRRQTIDAITQCNERIAHKLGLSVMECRSYFNQIASVCAEYAKSKWGGDYTFASCMTNDDILTKCTFVLMRGCEYTPELAMQVESVTLAKDRQAFEEAVRRSCEKPDPLHTLDLAKRGELKVGAKSQ